MAQVTYAPGCTVGWTSGIPGSTPTRLPKVLHADTVISIAPSVGTANLIISDPDGLWAQTIKPDDAINVVFSSRANKWKNLGQLQPGPASAWSGLVNSAVPAYDPRTQYGKALKINASTMWKPLVVTTVPLQFFFSGQYPSPGLSLLTLLSQAVFECEKNMHLTMATDFSQTSVPLQTSFTNVPSEMDVNDPQSQSWAVYLMSLLTAAGIEAFAREDGTLVVRDFQGMQNPDLRTLLSLPNGELFASSGGGVSDVGLLTNVIVSWSTQPSAVFAAVAPSNVLTDIGPLPPQLLDKSGKPLAQIGQRFASFTADFINQATDAERYASNMRSVGMAGVDTFQASLALNGDVRIGAQLLVPCYDRRYYVTTVGHYFEDQVDAETTISGNFGVPTKYLWNQTQMQGANIMNLGAQLSDQPGGSPTQRAANLAPPTNPNDPDVRWLPGMGIISTSDIEAVLTSKGSPFSDQQTYIWQTAQKAGINPAFALAVWQEECGLGTNQNAVTDLANHNPGSLGVTSTAGGGGYYATWADGIAAWFQQITGSLYVGGGKHTVSQIAHIYDPANEASWAANVTALMLAIISNAKLPAAALPNGAPAPSSTGTMSAAAAYAGTLATSIPKTKAGINNVLVPGTALGDFASKADYANIQCTTFIEYLMAKVGGIAGIINAATGVITVAQANAAQWGGYLPGLGFSNQTGNAPLPGDIVLFQPGELDPKTGQSPDYSEGDGHVTIVTAVNQPDSQDQGGSVTLASANSPTPVGEWTLTGSGGGTYTIGHLVDGGFFGATPFSWYRHA